MSKNKFYLIVIIALLISNGVALFFLIQKDSRRGAHKSPKEIIVERLDFDEEQEAQYIGLILEHREATKDLMDAILANRNTLYGMLSAKTSAEERDFIVSEIVALQAELEQLNVSHFEDIKALCIDNQLDRFDNLTQDLANLFGKRKGPPPPNRAK